MSPEVRDESEAQVVFSDGSRTALAAYGYESIIVARDGYEVRTPAFPKLCSYVRVVFWVDDKTQEEIVYWDREEWSDGDENPVTEGFGAIMAAIKMVADGSYRALEAIGRLVATGIVELEKCPTCKVEDHDVCSLTPGCPCCDDTITRGEQS